MHFTTRQPEGLFLAQAASGIAIRAGVVGKAVHWGKRATASGAVGMRNCMLVSKLVNSPVDSGVLIAP